MFRDDRFKGLTKSDLKRDFVAGITVGIVAIPLGMAFAIASGVAPEYGLYTTAIAGILVALLGGSRYQIAGPTGAFIPILLAIVLEYGYENLLIAGFMAGIMLVLMGIFKLGQLIKYIPRSVTIGFTAGIAVIIFSGQIGDFLGLEGLERKEFFHQNMLEIIKNIDTINLYSIAVGVIGLLLLIFIPKFFPRVPVLLVALIIPTIIVSIFFPNKVATIGSVFGGIPQALPEFQIPHITWDRIILLIKPAFVIAMLGGIESLLSAVVSDGMTGKRHDSDRELVGQGVANIVTPLFGGIPATGAIARTATNIKSGAVSPFSGVIQGVFVLAVVLLFAPLASNIPLAAMAPILMMVAYNMSEYRSFLHILKLKKADSLVLITTFLLTVFVNLTTAVQFGLLLAGIMFIKRMSEALDVEKVIPFTAKKDGKTSTENYDTICPEIAFYSIDGPLFFGAADRFETIITRSINQRPKILILRFKNVPFLDVTGANNLESLVSDFKKIGGTTFITEANQEVMDMLRKSNLIPIIGKHNFYRNADEAVDEALLRIQPTKCSICSRSGNTACRVFKQSKELHSNQSLQQNSS